MAIENWAYDDFVRVNGGKFSPLDFIHAVSTKISFPPDFLLCVGHLLAPRMIMFDGVIVAAEWFDEKRYGEYRGNGMTPQQAQAWVNAVELTEIFQGISLEKAKEFAYFIARLWDEAIKQNFPDEVTRASVVLEADLGEVFVTIGEFSD
ncbi:hypothetical protein [Burkholderia sp. Bp8963]|uniref:hypothetical protein n=1 Tax=Burkholderia sp. Bp8963 TaxID=2184547 RepID=UPI000F59E028|nr:hypothetical protein [Burkholderia sp. Bp8963]